VRTAVEAHLNFTIGNGDIGGHVDQISEDLTGLGIRIAAHPFGEYA